MDEHFPPLFIDLLKAYGHEAHSAADPGLGIVGSKDGKLLEIVRDGPYDFLLTLDHHRQAEVWPEMYTLLSQGCGRMVRIKPGSQEKATIPALALYWATKYREWSPELDRGRYALIQLGRGVVPGQGRGPGHYEMLTKKGVSALTQQAFGMSGPDLTTPSRPTVNKKR